MRTAVFDLSRRQLTCQQCNVQWPLKFHIMVLGGKGLPSVLLHWELRRLKGPPSGVEQLVLDCVKSFALVVAVRKAKNILAT